MGLEVAQNLQLDGWVVFILDLDAKRAQAVIQQNPDLHFLQVNVTDYDSLSSAFARVFETQGKVDFVFANAGIVQLENFYSRDSSLPPSKPKQNSIDINLKAAVNTSHLARHYFLASEHVEQDPVLIITASIASFVSILPLGITTIAFSWALANICPKYIQEFNPLYTASKAGVLAFMRSISAQLYREGIRTYAICPGTVRTNLLSNAYWDSFPKEYMTPMETITSTVRMLIKGGSMRDAQGRDVPKGKDFGLAVEIFGKEFYFREQTTYINDGMRQICEAASLENQQVNLQGTG